MFNKKKKKVKEEFKEEILEGKIENVENIELSEDDNEIEITKDGEEKKEQINKETIDKEKVPNAPEVELQHPLITFYSYILDLESRILQLESSQDKIILYLQSNDQEGKKS